MSEPNTNEQKPQQQEENKAPAQGDAGEKKLYLDEVTGDMVSKKYIISCINFLIVS